MNLHNEISVIYETQILDGKTGRVVKRNAPKPNLILDSGLNGLASRSSWASFSHCVLGDGTTPTKLDSGGITVSITGDVATASAGYFETAHLGQLLKLDSGEEYYIMYVLSATEVEISSTSAGDAAASEFTIWYVSETGHSNELVRTSNLSTDSGDVSSTWDGSKIEHKRTFIFPVETSSRTYREIGWSHTSSAGGNLFGRDLIPGGGDSIAEGQQYKVEVRLQVTLSPISQTSIANVGSGWDTSGDAIFRNIHQAFQGANTGGAFTTGQGKAEPHLSGRRVMLIGSDFTLGNLSTSQVPLPADTNTNRKRSTRPGYISWSREVFNTVTFETTESNGTFYGLILAGIADNDDNVFWIKFNTPQVKDSDHKLTLTFRQSWGRTLTN